MNGSRVSFDHVWKKFRRGERGRASENVFWALEDVSFEVSAGEALGIIGPNGAGKSTTLKLLTKILRPTQGRCEIRGRVGALIEVAAGFHPDLSGRENIYLQGAIMGMSRGEITRKLDDIIEFSGLGDFIDTQVKRYSSGMNARLGFSIAANLEPDVLLIDEVLAVGDMAFQQRCVDRMQEFRDKGAAIVFVSHDLQTVASLCQRAIFLKGSIRAEGSAQDAILAYIMSVAPRIEVDESATVQVTDVALTVGGGSRVSDVVMPGQRLELACALRAIATDVSDAQIAIRVLRSTDGLMIDEMVYPLSSIGLPGLPAGQSVNARIAFEVNVPRGHYHVDLAILSGDAQKRLGRTSPLSFVVDERRTWAGATYLDVRASVGRDD